MTPYKQGYEAAKAGKTQWKNPYTPGTSNYNEWFRGWYDYFFEQGEDPKW